MMSGVAPEVVRSSFLRLSPEVVHCFPPGRRYLIGVSGGRDSVALFHALLEHGYRKLIVCHLNHELRGRESAGDSELVAQLANEQGLICELGSADVRQLAAAARLSLETAGRAARFAFFADVARRHRCPTIFLAHQADDLVETALLNLFRGAAPGGVAALRPVRVHRIGRRKLTILRPLLATWRREIDAYTGQHELRYRDDSTNTELHAARNRIRHRILPFLERELGRDVRRSIWRTAEIWGEQELLLDATAPATIGRTLSVLELRQMPIAAQRRTVHRWLVQSGVGQVSFDLVENVRMLARAGASTAKVNLPGDRYARRQAKLMFIE